MTDALGTRTFTYNDALQLAAETNLLGVLTRTYDDQGRPAGFTAGRASSPSAPDYSVTYGYSDSGRFHSVSSSVQSVSFAVDYSYLPNTDLIAGYSIGDFATTRAYEPNRNLITSISNAWGATPISTFAYQNDPLGRRTERIDITQSALGRQGHTWI